MSADIITDTTYPHGTAEGFTNGCRGSHCPATVACRDVHTRYNGDWAYRQLINQGHTSQDIHDAEQAAITRAEEERRQRIHTAAQARHNATRKARRATVRTGNPRTPATDLQRTIAALNSDGLTDRQIGDQIGKTREQVTATRKWLGLACNPSRPGPKAPATTGASSLEGS